MHRPHCAIFTAALLLFCAGRAGADIKFKEGHWRIEAAAATGVHSGSTDRSGDILVTVSAEYEFPATQRTTLGLRLLPLVIYEQDEEDDDDRRLVERLFHHDDDDGGDTVFGGGFGVTGRVYQVKGEYRGLFLEGEANALVHTGRLNGNSSNVNFLTGIGVGYKFKGGVHLVARYEHISNAGLGDENSGANTVGLGVGFSF